MRILKFSVDGQRLYRDPASDFSGIIRGSWRSDQEIDAAPVISGTCMIPDSVTDYREFEVSLVGIRDSYRITTNRVKVEQEV